MGDFTNEIISNIPKFWKNHEDSTNYKFILSFEPEFNNVETELINFKQGWQINAAAGTDLDKIALKYNLSRTQYDTDDSFRAKIKTYLLTFSGSGTPTDIKNILSFYTGLDTADITVTLIREMVFSISIALDKNTDITILNNVVNVIPNIKAAGTYVLDLDYTSKDNIFLTNLSETNGIDLII